MTRRLAGLSAIALALLALAGAAVWRWAAPQRASVALPAPCREEVFEQDAFIICALDPQLYSIELRLTDTAGKPLGKLEAAAREPDLVFAMNAGMYHQDQSPVGLYVENGVERAPLNTGDADGNFFMKPNGVFSIGRNGSPAIVETARYQTARPDIAYATQSGPMLVIDGQIHPRFEPDGASRHIRNGVGVDAAGRAVFAVSRHAVSFGKFARLFRDALECQNALFLDGAVSGLHDGKRYIVGAGFPVGPIIVARTRQGGNGG